MISSCMKHSRSAQRRPWRSFSSTACAVGARRDHLGLEQLRQRRAEHILAAGMFFGERIDRRGDPRGIETVVRSGAVLGHDAIHDLSRYRTAQGLSRAIVGQQ